jgi:hypothetical protein
MVSRLGREGTIGLRKFAGEMRTMVAGQVARWKKVVPGANIPQQ